MDTAYAEFVSIFSEQYNICCPVKTIQAEVARRDKPWITNGLTNACRKKNRLYRIWLHSQTPAAESRYKTYKNKLTSILRTAEKEHYSKLLSDAKGNIKNTWTILNAAMNKKRALLNFRVMSRNTLFQITSFCTSIFCKYSLFSYVCNFVITLQEHYHHDC